MIEIKAQKRNKRKKSSLKLRKEGFLPAILYGRKIENVLLKVKNNDFNKLYRKIGRGSQIIKLSIEGESNLRDVLLQDIQKDALTDQPIHIDFYQVKAGEEIEKSVPLVFIGDASAVKELGGILVKYLHQIEVKSLPRHLPNEIEVNVGSLKTFDDFIRVKDLNLSPDVKVLTDSNEVIAAVVEQKEEKEIEEAPEADESPSKESKDEENEENKE